MLPLQSFGVYFIFYVFYLKFIDVVFGDWSVSYLLCHTKSRTPENVQQLLSITAVFIISLVISLLLLSLRITDILGRPGRAKTGLWNLEFASLCMVCKAGVSP